MFEKRIKNNNMYLFIINLFIIVINDNVEWNSVLIIYIICYFF